MKKVLILLTLALVGCSQSDQTLTECQQFCRDNQGEKCYDLSGDEFSSGDTDGDAGCGASIEECLNNCQADSSNKKKP